ncbi:GNAT family N-acetyltransferase [Deferribacterales bacterium Es71-Z0220]|jgi:ribosomal protein S18 acetylase RimI-like enzyme|uniref:GNAT family N-acetyltransferase n=1 Tax=Deferrivibrio essentukiensis TaxID=2880922 RepID=UPI001F621A41|nr:GNAT family N-acetyltransferase [Deferrivibrio essentukiensis]MCB4203979.1 GNAT family N-acetyltransferase [Deferrivibrio essentukiensis]
MAGIIFRGIKLQDLAEIYSLGEKVFTLQKYPNLYRIWDESEVTEFFVNNRESCFVAECEGKIVGFILSYVVNKARIRYGYLVWLCVDSDYEAKGVASQLFDEFKTYMKDKGIKNLFVDVEKSNQRALNFFRRKGFCEPKEQIYLTLYLDKEGKDENK